MSREAFEKWLEEDSGFDINFLTTDEKTIAFDAWQACAEEKDKRIAELTAQNKELVEVADMLLMAKDYKEQVGKDDAYETMKNLAWANLRAIVAKVKGE